MRLADGLGDMGRLALAALIALAALGGAARTEASTLAVTDYTLGELVQIQSGAARGSVYTAEFAVRLDGQSGFSYCVDLAQTIGTGSSSGWDPLSPESNARVIRAAWLVDRFHSASPPRAALTALQLAVWETMADTGNGYDLFGGTFALEENGASDAALMLARDYLGALADADLTGFATNAIWAVHKYKQDQLVFTNPVPEPSSVGLLLLGGVVVAQAVRRKRGQPRA